jgi:exosortase/archaeosortase family protein
LLLYLFAFTLPQGIFECLNSYSAEITADLLRLVWLNPAVCGPYISLDRFSVMIARECSVIYLIIPYLSFLLAYPSPVKDKGTGILFGATALFFLNSLRAALILITGTMNPALAECLHLYIGQVVLILAVLLLCLFWLKAAVSEEPVDPDMQFVRSVMIFSGIMFAGWAYLRTLYASALQGILLFVIKIIGCRPDILAHVSMNQGPFTTMNIVTFGALVFAARSVRLTRRISIILIGLVVLTLVHALCAGLELLLIRNHVSPGFRPVAIAGTLFILAQWMLPFVLWRQLVFRRCA